jgi:hypothetical protein
MNEKDCPVQTAATFYGNETVNESTLISPVSSARLSCRSFGSCATEPAAREESPCLVSVESLPKVSQWSGETLKQTIIRWNITRFRNLLQTLSDPQTQTLASKLLAEEQAKLLSSVIQRCVQARRSANKNS